MYTLDFDTLEGIENHSIFDIVSAKNLGVISGYILHQERMADGMILKV